MIDISEGVLLFNDNDFFSAHDFFENIWMEVNINEKVFFQGLVQISVGCYHLICGNLKGAESQLSKGIDKLEAFKPVFYQINIQKFTKEILVLLDNLENVNIIYKIPKIELTT
jgi:predicted metal-dependent hydrolase